MEGKRQKAKEKMKLLNKNAIEVDARRKHNASALICHR